MANPRVRSRGSGRGRCRVWKKMNQVKVAPYLCDELVSNILLRVPPKTFSRCKLVCKHWLNLINDTYFSKAVKNLPHITAGFCYFEGQYPSKIKYYCYITNKIYHYELKPPFRVVISHKGFLLCADDSTNARNLFICNPYTKQSLLLPTNPNLSEVRANDLVLFCYDKEGSDTLDFLVLTFRFSELVDMLFVHIYSSVTGEWRIPKMLNVPQTHSCCFLSSECNKILLDPGFVYHWHPLYPQMGVYDLNRGSIRFITLPRTDHGESHTTTYHLGISAGSVYYAESYFFGTSISIWAHDRRYKWSLKHVVSCKQEPKFGGNHTFRLVGFHPMKLGLIGHCDPLGFRGRGDHLQVFLYDVDRKKVQRLPSFCPIIGDNAVTVPYSLPGRLLRLNISRSSYQYLLRSPLSLHEDIVEEDPTTSEYRLNFPALK